VTEPFDEPLAREVGLLCAIAETSDIVDASVVLVARSLGAAVVTSDEPDISHLATPVGAALAIHQMSGHPALP